jgi:hypothetical protein
MDPDEEMPPLAWRWLSIIAVLLLIVVAGGIGLISAGVFDPKPLGTAKDEFPLNHMEIPGNGQELNWIERRYPLEIFTVRLTAAKKTGETDVAYGLALGDEDNFLVIAISPLGYYSIWRGSNLTGRLQKSQVVEPWQTWPHIRVENNPNEIWIDIQNKRITTIRINREILWQGSLSIEDGSIGLWAQSFGEPAHIDFQKMEVFTQQVE